ncbi:MAG: ATP synthase F1 subunit epsilon [Candidatus Nomurabacteria bacterium]|jgi:F-type H+-transporting ATPase subunit epsilon|nr:ATP synthase F1 subunit epsilon [Candidatus Nomurabacteria bacterium]
MKFRLVTLLGEKISEDVYEVILPTVSGEIAVFPSHESLVTLAKPGVMAVRRKKTDPDDAMEYFATSGGIIEISSDHVKVLVDEADYSDEIVEAEAQKALERAMEMRESAVDQVELEKASELIDRHAVRLKVAELRRHYRRPRP